MSADIWLIRLPWAGRGPRFYQQAGHPDRVFTLSVWREIAWQQNAYLGVKT